MSRLLRGAVILLVWLALWSDVTVANVLSGIAVAFAIVVLFDTWKRGTLAVRPLRALHFAGFFLFKLIEANLTVARTVITPKGRLHTGIIAVPLSGCTDAVATLVADAITLTPGTMTLEVKRDPLTLYIHALDTRDVDQVRADVRRLEVLAIRAFGNQEAIDGLEIDDTTTWSGR